MSIIRNLRWYIKGLKKVHELRKYNEEKQTNLLIDYMKKEAEKPSLELIKMARKDEEKRRKVEAEGIPESVIKVMELHNKQKKQQ